MPHLLDRRAFGNAMSRERSRADRSGTPFSLVVCSEPGSSGNGNGMLQSELMAGLAEALADRIRCTDVAGWFDDDVLAVILPHTTGQEAWNLVERVQARLKGRLRNAEGPDAISYRVHSYPFHSARPQAASTRQLSLFDGRLEPGAK
jgi:PleD family two-component response regulator